MEADERVREDGRRERKEKKEKRKLEAEESVRDE